MPKNLVYDLTEDEKTDVAERVRGSDLVWDAVETWVRQRLNGASPEKAMESLVVVLEIETDYFVNAWPEKAGPDEDDHPWEAA